MNPFLPTDVAFFLTQAKKQESRLPQLLPFLKFFEKIAT
jgi:hypothetical protein